MTTTRRHEREPVPARRRGVRLRARGRRDRREAGSNLTVKEAADHIIGYSVFNDWSGYHVQQHKMTQSMGPVTGKDTATGLGLYLVTKDEPARTPPRPDSIVR